VTKLKKLGRRSLVQVRNSERNMYVRCTCTAVYLYSTIMGEKSYLKNRPG
jgi:hypothetical protein